MQVTAGVVSVRFSSEPDATLLDGVDPRDLKKVSLGFLGGADTRSCAECKEPVRFAIPSGFVRRLRTAAQDASSESKGVFGVGN